MRIPRFLRHPAVSVREIVARAPARTAGRVVGRPVLAIQDTTDVRVASATSGIVLPPTVAVDAADGTLLGLVQAELLGRTGAQRGRQPRLRRPAEPALAARRRTGGRSPRGRGRRHHGHRRPRGRYL
jgi:hypothetical protein